MVEVVREPDAHAAVGRTDERPPNDVRGLVAQADVVQREVERGARCVDEGGDGLRRVEGRLAAVGQQPQLEAVAGRGYADCARIFALCARFASW